MSKTATDCCICHVAPATDQFGWCDHCARLYDEPTEPTAGDLAEAQHTFQAAVLREILLAQVAANSLSNLRYS